MAGCYPLPRDVIFGILAVVVGCVGASFAAYLGRRTYNWIHYITATGSALFVLGVVGQRAYGASQNARMALACPAGLFPSNAWTASIELPVLGVWVNAVAMAGLLVTVVGVCGVLLFERVGVPTKEEPNHPERFEDADAV